MSEILTASQRMLEQAKKQTKEAEELARKELNQLERDIKKSIKNAQNTIEADIQSLANQSNHKRISLAIMCAISATISITLILAIILLTYQSSSKTLLNYIEGENGQRWIQCETTYTDQPSQRQFCQIK